jgi:hypothetical protein
MPVRDLTAGGPPGYACNVAQLQLGSNRCQSVRGAGVAAAVAARCVPARQPAQRASSLAARDQVAAPARALEHQGPVQVERARSDADLARRR